MMTIINLLLAQRGFTPFLLGVAVVMYATWIGAYVMIIITGFRDKSYGVPMASIPLNVVWECIFSFNTVTHPGIFFLWGNRLWLIPDAFIVWQLFRYGKSAQVVPWLQRNFYSVVVLAFVMSGVGLYNFLLYFNDLKGAAASEMMNLVMSVLFIRMLFDRPDLKGISYSAAWLKMVGTVCGAIFLYFWWPAQFQDGILVGHPGVHEPSTYNFMMFLYCGCFFFDCVYLYQLTAVRKRLRTSALLTTQGAV